MLNNTHSSMHPPAFDCGFSGQSLALHLVADHPLNHPQPPSSPAPECAAPLVFELATQLPAHDWRCHWGETIQRSLRKRRLHSPSG